jgi:hypothetical protein
MSDVTQLLSAIEGGDPNASISFAARLRGIAKTGRSYGQEKPGQTLQATALVHEAWLRLTNPGTKKYGTVVAIFLAPRLKRCDVFW